MAMALVEAMNAVKAGTPMGDVYEQVPDHLKPRLKEWYVTTAGVPNLSARGKADRVTTARDSGYSGETCATCGSAAMRRSGTCLVCDACGSTSGGCG